MGVHMDLSEEEVLRATEESKMDDPDGAIELLRGFLSLHPKSVRVRLRLAFVYSCDYGEGHAGAERIYRDVLNDDPNNVAALSGLAMLPGYPEVSVTTDERLLMLTKVADLTGETWALSNLAFKAWDDGRKEEAVGAFLRLKAVANSRGEKRLARLAQDSLKAISKGERSRVGQYSWPEI